MSKVFLGGSRNLGRLNPAIRTRLQNLITNRHTVLIGDANGVDRAVQSFFATEGYQDVIVYCMDGECRNNVGAWPVRAIDSGGRKKDFAYYVLKDEEMSLSADYGFMIWDGKSKGTLNNILNLVQQGKSVLVYRSPSCEFSQVKDTDDVERLAANCPPEVVEYLNRKISLKKRVPSADQTALTF